MTTFRQVILFFEATLDRTDLSPLPRLTALFFLPPPLFCVFVPRLSRGSYPNTLKFFPTSSKFMTAESTLSEELMPRELFFSFFLLTLNTDEISALVTFLCFVFPIAERFSELHHVDEIGILRSYFTSPSNPFVSMLEFCCQVYQCLQFSFTLPRLFRFSPATS